MTGRRDLRQPHQQAFLRIALLALCLAGIAGCDRADDRVAVDPSTDRQARRIIALAPHLTELIFRAGAGEYLVGVVEFSDYPGAASALPRVGDAFRLDYEAIADLQPDLILGWQSGTPTNVLARLQGLGYRVVALEPGSFNSIAEHLRIIGRLAGTASAAHTAAAEYDQQLKQLRSRYEGTANISVFYQLSARPMLTISRHHLIGQAIELCGGRNVFAGLDELTPAVSVEAVLDRSPEVIIGSSFGAQGNQNLDRLSAWSRWTHIPAVRDDNLFLVDADQIVRPSTRILGGVREVCEKLEAAREKKTS